MEDSNMKKTYINPAIEVVKLKMNCQILAGSLDKYTEEVTSEGDVLSRSFDFDDDEEDW